MGCSFAIVAYPVESDSINIKTNLLIISQFQRILRKNRLKSIIFVFKRGIYGVVKI